MTERVPASLLAALVDLVKWFEATHIPSVVIGGIACSLLGRPRLTQDIDALAILPEIDLLVMKAIAHRPKDLQDVEGLLDAHPGANVEAVREHVRNFANAVSMSDLVDHFDKALERRKAKQHLRKT